jgi:hypothetical protein
MEQNSFNCYSFNIKLQTECTYITYENTNDLLLVGDNKGMISLFDLRKSKAIKIINTKVKNEIK